MNGLGKTANKTGTNLKVGGRSRSIFEAILSANGSSIFEMLREPHGGKSIFEEVRYAKHLAANPRNKKGSILDVDWKKKNRN
ncbi:MAG: hypothetical protein NE328_05050 [Lentisphaeraceae bacterium]|nr:hypothetical protein [Lentisphaeraceae bacterium]